MGAALAQILRSLAHVCEDAEWHSKCCTEEVGPGCTCDAETHGGSGPERDVAAGTNCCWIEAHEGGHEGPNAPEEVKDLGEDAEG